jgi:hypothetical protein
MRFSLISLVSLVSSVSAVGNAIVKNNSKNTFYLWSVGSTLGDMQTIAPGMLLLHPLNSGANKNQEETTRSLFVRMQPQVALL